VFSQNLLDAPLERSKMTEDLELFRALRQAANSGVYKYRTVSEIDSIYGWARQEIEQSNSMRDFFNIISQITDFEGSLHNSTRPSKKVMKSIVEEPTGYFPFTIKFIEDSWVVNNSEVEIPLGSRIVSIKGEKMEDVISSLYKYSTTDGYNISGKLVEINRNFPLFYRLSRGLQDSFDITFMADNGSAQRINLSGVSYNKFQEDFKKRHSKPSDYLGYTFFTDLKDSGELYSSRYINDSTAILIINSFVIGWNAEHPDHKEYKLYLDSIFMDFKQNSVKNLIVDVRYNRGGADPNDLLTYTYLTDRKFQENIEAWIPFRKIPYWSRVKGFSFWPIRFIVKRSLEKELKKDFHIEKNNRYYQDETSSDQKVWSPSPHAFNGKIYLLVAPYVSSAGSLFAALLASDSGTTTIGEETMGGYYGHNGHIPITYQLTRLWTC
jgi:hypothetical protein